MSRELICSVIETSLNAGRHLLVDQAASLDKLEGNTLALTVSEWQFPLQFEVHQQRFLVRSPEQVSAQCHLSCDLATLPKLQERHKLTQLIRENKLDLDGDIDVAQRFAALADGKNIDVEEWLSTYLGDALAFKLGQAGKRLGTQLQKTMERGKRDLKDYLVDEIKLLPEQNEFHCFAESVDTVALALANLEARINSLSK